MSKVVSAAEAVQAIPDGAVLSVGGSGGGVLEPRALLMALEERFQATGHPRDLTLVHCTGIGDRTAGGLTHLAHPGLIRRVIAGNWAMSQAMGQLALTDQIEAYNFPQGVMSQLHREIAAGRPGLVTHVGLHTFVDPRYEGGKMNRRTTEDLVEVVTLRGREYLFYPAFPIDYAFIRGTTADEEGNLTFEQEGAVLDMLAIAQAAHNSGGRVIAQVKRLARAGTLHPHRVVVPGIIVDQVVVVPGQWQTSEGEYHPAISGELKMPVDVIPRLPLNERKIVARRALAELWPGAVVNLGVGMADGITAVAAEEGVLDRFVLTIEQGVIGGGPALGLIFGVAYNPTAIIDQPAQFDFYDGGGLDIAFLGCAEIDRHGNVNVSKFGNRLVGTGGFIDISQNARKVVFCGTLTAGNLLISVRDGRLSIEREGRHRKFVERVEQVTFNAAYARARGKPVLYVTERAVFELGDQGLVLTEIAPGVDLERDVLSRMGFRPVISPQLRLMDERYFRPGPVGYEAFVRHAVDRHAVEHPTGSEGATTLPAVAQIQAGDHEMDGKEEDS
jgi:propionate CoA-transferase